MTYLYAGAILLIDLGSNKITREPTSRYTNDYLGGRGINIRLLYEHIAPGVDPMGPENILVFGVGPLGGTSISTSRTEVTAKSPVTGFLGSSNFGGQFGAELKYAGFDHIVITGKADKPVYIRIHNDHVEIREAGLLRAKDAYQTQDILRNELDDPDTKVLCIGPAGENLVQFATIQHGLGHAAGRTGMGAVMGAKNLKAIAVRGTGGVKLARPDEFLSIAEELEQDIKNHPWCQEMVQRGTSGYMEEQVHFLYPEAPNQHDIYRKFKPKKSGCFGCPVQCMDLYQGEGNHSGAISCELYPSLSWQPKCYDTDVSLECAILSQRYGVDCISVGESISWLMELYEKGIITEKETDGIPMEWGSAEAMRGMLEKIVFRKGIGDVLARGILPTIEAIGRGALDYANQVKGMFMTEGQSPKWLPSLRGTSLAAAVGPRGDTMRALPPGVEAELDPDLAEQFTGNKKAADPNAYEGKPEIVIFMENVVAICDSLSTCKFISLWSGLTNPYTPQYQARLFAAGSGQETTVEDLFNYANKIRTLERAYESGEGMGRNRDTLPKSFTDQEIEEEGWFKGTILESRELEKMKDRYYALRQWDVETGTPTGETLSRLGLEDVANDLAKRELLPTGKKSRTDNQEVKK